MTTTTVTTPELLRQDCLGRIRTPRERREKLLDEYERSGMRVPAFATFAGIKYTTLATWIQQRRRGRADNVRKGGCCPNPSKGDKIPDNGM